MPQHEAVQFLTAVLKMKFARQLDFPEAGYFHVEV
jgi:hypothetical protein